MKNIKTLSFENEKPSIVEELNRAYLDLLKNIEEQKIQQIEAAGDSKIRDFKMPDLEDLRARFPKIIREIRGDFEAYYYNTGSLTGVFLVAFKATSCNVPHVPGNLFLEPSKTFRVESSLQLVVITEEPGIFK